MTKEIEHTVRSYWLTGQASVGALLRFGNITVVVADLRYWKFRSGEPYGERIFAMTRLKGILHGERELRKPLVQERQQYAAGYTAPMQQLPVVRFPSWLHCSSCGHLSYLPWRGGESMLEEVRCRQCDAKPRLKPAPWVVVSEGGLLADFPWKGLAHHGNRKGPPIRCEEVDRLYLNRDPKTGEDILKCRHCGSNRSLKNIDHDPIEQWTQFMPWQPWDRALTYADAMKERKCTHSSNRARAIRLTDLRLHQASNASAVDIPPESRLDKNDMRFKLQRHKDYEKWIKIANQRQLQAKLQTQARLWGVEYADLQKAWDDLAEGWPENIPGATIPQSIIELRAQEYRVFTEDWGQMRDEERFIVRKFTAEWQALCQETKDPIERRIAELVAVDKLREIRVFRGFQRLNSGITVPPDLTGEENWTCAVELHGEGIFVTLDEQAVSRWECQAAVKKRVEPIRKRFAENPLLSIVELLGSNEDSSHISPRFIMLHTLAHLLIRQLEFEAGVPAASIRERIYCCHEPVDSTVPKMAGILLYTMSPDLAGSLAGLSVLAEPPVFRRILHAALTRGQWCSFDPVCMESEGTGPGALNRAACHGCCLVPEPSCEFSNCLLDRALVISPRQHNGREYSFFALDPT